MSVRSLSLGMSPASEFLVAFTITITRIVVLPSFGRAAGSAAACGFKVATNEADGDRHAEELFLPRPAPSRENRVTSMSYLGVDGDDGGVSESLDHPRCGFRNAAGITCSRDFSS